MNTTARDRGASTLNASPDAQAPSPGEYHADLAKAGAHVDSRLSMALFLARRYPLGGVGLVIVVLFVLVALFAPYITWYDPLSTNAEVSLASPSLDRPMGAD